MQKLYDLLSRRNVDDEVKTDFGPDHPEGTSPFAQLRRLRRVLASSTMPADNYSGMDEALSAYREHIYRKVYSGTTHDEFVKLDQEDPQRIDWLLAVSVVDTEHYAALKELRNPPNSRGVRKPNS